ncbi:hypothetical protein ACFO1B_44220 [Dactylosporangium siamense]|uniref:Uncharacterized protein n=1 Tax=Dactylosporangium siamense TaxID=685454 RepID=A0A919PWW8_9ACTN|nr:hypothetical protein [Dactylosporangium siamense]GIG51167.1 hypothetical protein Dsi01nite_092080 [Dactylosporangium siamense]
MSFGVGVWFEPGPVTEQQVAERYRKLSVAGVHGVAPTQPQVAAFYRQLIGLYPELGTVIGEETDRRSPWAARFATTPVSVCMSIAAAEADDMPAHVRELADYHQLVCYSPQTGATSIPDVANDGEGHLLGSCDGSRSVNPAPAHIEQTLRRLSAENSFVLLRHRDNGTSLQVLPTDRTGDPEGLYRLTLVTTGVGTLRITWASDLSDVIEAFQRYVSGDGTWTDRFIWV